MSTITLPTNALNATYTGDLDIFDGSVVDNGTGTIHIRNGGLYVEGLTDLDETTINTGDGNFTVTGTNKIDFNISGGATSSIEMTAEDTSFFTATAGTLTVSATATDANGKIIIRGSGTGTDSVLIDAPNATSGQVTIQSAGGSTGSNAVRILATDTTDGDILIKGSGNYVGSNPAVLIQADNAVSGQIRLTSAGASTTIDSVQVIASNTTEGNVLIQGRGINTNAPSVKILADNATSGQVKLESAGNIQAGIYLHSTDATGGGVKIQAVGGAVSIDTANTATGITIGTATAGVPVTIGTSSSVTTIAGDLTVAGTTVTLNTETLTVEDNVILLNAGNGELGLDSGLVIRRFQTPNDAGTGNVVNSVATEPITESGIFQAGAATPGTLVLSLFASDTTDYYKGWWIKITSGDGIDQVRRIKSYVQATKTATLYVTADNTTPTNGPPFIDGLDLATAPAAADTYELYNDVYSTSYYDEALDTWSFGTSAVIPDPISGSSSNIVLQNYQHINTGVIDSFPQVYRNTFGSASTTTVTFTIRNHGQIALNKIYVADSADFTPEITTGQYIITSVTTNTIVITVGASTVSTTASSATVTLQNTSKIIANVIEPHDAGFGISIPGLSLTEDIIIPKTSTAQFAVTVSETYGAYFMIVSDKDNTDGAFSVFAVTSAGSGGSVSRMSSSRGADNQRVNATWDSTEKVEIFHSPAGSGGGNYTYTVRIFSAI